MSYRLRASSVACALLLGAACGLDTSGTANGHAAPRDLRLGEEVFDVLVLSWTPSTSDPYAWYDIENAEGGEAFRDAMHGIPSNLTRFEFRLSPQSAELTTWTFRIQTCGGRPFWACSGWNAVAYQRGLRPPILQAAIAAGRADLRWTNNSAVATALSLERVETALDGSGELVVPIPLSANANAYTDGELVAGRLYRYRLRVGKDAVWSAPAETEPFRVDGAAPVASRVERLLRAATPEDSLHE